MTDLASLRAAIGVEPVDEHRSRGDTAIGGVERGGLFGGQMIAQALSACAHTTPEGSVPDSIHVNLLGASRTGVPVDYVVERVRDGGALHHRDVRGLQEGALVLQATVVSSMPSDGLDWQDVRMPAVGPPDTSSRAGRPWSIGLGQGAFDVAYPVTEDDGEPPFHPHWLRAVADIPDDPWLRGAIVAFWSDFGLNGAARSTHERVAGPTSSVSATHSLWFNRRTSPNDWHLFDVHPESLAGNQGMVRAALFHENGALVASILQGIFIRRPRS